MVNRITAIFGFIFFNISVFAQTEPFSIVIEPINIPELGGLQSFTFGQHDGKWLIVGGRKDGLHRMQPFAAFALPGQNSMLTVIDPVLKQKWTAPLTSLAPALQEQLSSTNMNFYQQGNYLYCLGGYGYSATFRNHITYANLTAINVAEVINAIIENKDFSPFFRQISDFKFQVAGGRLKKINDTYYLAGGQKFMGRYNPMGPDHGPGFEQEYTDAIRKFKIVDDGKQIIITHLASFVDSENLHRRDYNAEPQILPNGEEGITMFSGAFQPTANIPYLTAVTINSENYTKEKNFKQFYNHYHCAVLPIYSEVKNEMHNVFFGGIAQYYDSAGVTIKDDDIPFVKSIARVTRDANGILSEYKLPIEMPVFLGAGAEFIPNKNISHYKNEVIKLDKLTADSTLVGYIFGGISSSAKNIFFKNSGGESSASSTLFKVYVKRNKAIK